jgi:uncharacterized protein YciI
LEEYGEANDYTGFYITFFCEDSTIIIEEFEISKTTISLAYVLTDLCFLIIFYAALLNVQVCENKAMAKFQRENGLASGYSILLKGLPKKGLEDDLKAHLWEHLDKYLAQAKAEGKIKCAGKVADIQFSVTSLVHLQKEIYVHEKKIIVSRMMIEKLLNAHIAAFPDWSFQKLEKDLTYLKTPDIIKNLHVSLDKKDKKKLEKLLKKYRNLSNKLLKLQATAMKPEVQKKKAVNHSFYQQIK